MKKRICLLLALLVACCATGVALAETTELVVFAAASMTETLTEIRAAYEAEHPDVSLVFNFDSSGTLKTQIQEGAVCDVFISAGQKQMNQLDISRDGSANPDRLDFVAAGTRIDLLENKVTLVVPEGNPKGIAGFDDLAGRLASGDVLLAMGNSDVPVGQYTQKILAFYGLDEAALAKAGALTYGTNVKEVTTQVKEASVDCGVIYGTDAYSADLTVVDSATAEMCGQVIYPAAVLSTSAHPEAAQAFLDYLTGDAAFAVFEGVGFTPVRAEYSHRRREDAARFLREAIAAPALCYGGRHMDWYPLLNFLRIAAISSVIVFFLGIGAAYYASRLPRLVKGVLDVVLTLPMVLPPTVCGYFLLLVFGAKRPLGMLLAQLGVKFVMHWSGGVLAASVVAFPLMYRTARGAFESFDRTLADAGRTLGLSNTFIFWRIRMPACRQGILAGAVLSFARALGEYGATSMLIGYTPGRTATISTTVYQLWRTNDEAGAMFWVLVNLAISTVVLLIVNLLEERQKKAVRRA